MQIFPRYSVLVSIVGGVFTNSWLPMRLSFLTGAIIALSAGKYVYKGAFLADKNVFSSRSIGKSVSLSAILRTKPVALQYQAFMGSF